MGSKFFYACSQLRDLFVVLKTFQKILRQFAMFPLHIACHLCCFENKLSNNLKNLFQRNLLKSLLEFLNPFTIWTRRSGSTIIKCISSGKSVTITHLAEGFRIFFLRRTNFLIGLRAFGEQGVVWKTIVKTPKLRDWWSSCTQHVLETDYMPFISSRPSTQYIKF